MRFLKGLSFKQRLFGTLSCVIVYVLMLLIPIPFANRAAAADYISGSGLSIFERLTGGDLSNVSFAALGISPYISASILLQLAGVVIPAVHTMQKNGSAGERALKRITFIITIIISLLLSFGFASSYATNGLLTSSSPMTIFLTGISFTIGVVVLCSLAFLITEYFFGNGVSIFLFCGIVRTLIRDFISYYFLISEKFPGVARYCIFGLVLALAVGFFVFIAWLNRKDKLIPVVRPMRLSSTGALDVKYTSIPIRMLSGGVMPAVFASSMFAFPRLIASFVGSSASWLDIFDSSKWFLNGVPQIALVGCLVYFGFILWAEFYCQSLSASPSEMADSFKQGSAVVNGLMPGKTTEAFLKKEFSQAAKRSSLVMAGIVILPMIVSSWFSVPMMGFIGTSSVIVVVVFCELLAEFRNGVRFDHLKKVKNIFVADKIRVDGGLSVENR